MLWLRRNKAIFLVLLGVLFVVLVYGIQFGWMNANDPLAAPIALAFVVVLLVVLLA